MAGALIRLCAGRFICVVIARRKMMTNDRESRPTSHPGFIGTLGLLLGLSLLAGCGSTGGGGDGSPTSDAGGTTCVWDNPNSTWDSCGGIGVGVLFLHKERNP